MSKQEDNCLGYFLYYGITGLLELVKGAVAAFICSVFGIAACWLFAHRFMGFEQLCWFFNGAMLSAIFFWRTDHIEEFWADFSSKPPK